MLAGRSWLWRPEKPHSLINFYIALQMSFEIEQKFVFQYEIIRLAVDLKEYTLENFHLL